MDLLEQYIRVLHEEVVLLGHAAGRAAVGLERSVGQQSHVVEMLLFIAQLLLTTSGLLTALAVEPQERERDQRQQDNGEAAS